MLHWGQGRTADGGLPNTESAADGRAQPPGLGSSLLPQGQSFHLHTSVCSYYCIGVFDVIIAPVYLMF